MILNRSRSRKTHREIVVLPPLGPAHGLAQPVQAQGAVGQVGQRIVQRLVAELLLHGLAVGDVAEAEPHAQRLAADAGHGPADHAEPADLALGVLDAEVQGVAPVGVGLHQVGVPGILVVLDDDLADQAGVFEESLLGIAGDPLAGRGAVVDGLVRADPDLPVVGEVRDGPVPLLAFLKHAHQSFALALDQGLLLLAEAGLPDDVQGEQGADQQDAHEDRGDAVAINRDLLFQVLQVQAGSDDPAPGREQADVGQLVADAARLVLPLPVVVHELVLPLFRGLDELREQPLAVPVAEVGQVLAVQLRAVGVHDHARSQVRDPEVVHVVVAVAGGLEQLHAELPGVVAGDLAAPGHVVQAGQGGDDRVGDLQHAVLLGLEEGGFDGGQEVEKDRTGEQHKHYRRREQDPDGGEFEVMGPLVLRHGFRSVLSDSFLFLHLYSV